MDTTATSTGAPTSSSGIGYTLNEQGYVDQNESNAVLNKLRREGSNKICFDCPAKNPSWASARFVYLIIYDYIYFIYLNLSSFMSIYLLILYSVFIRNFAVSDDANVMYT